MRTYPGSAACVRLLALAMSLAGVGCFGYERTSTLGPSSSGIAALIGSWTSASAIPAAESCTDFRWDVTEQSGNSASGAFSATCAGNLKVSGTATGTLTGSTVNWRAEANASLPDQPACPITLTGTAELNGDSISVPYAGDTCVGRVSGVEVLRRR